MAFAFLGGALAILNPCGFPLLIAHLSMSLEEDRRGRAAARVGLARGLAVASGFVTVLLAVSIPLALGLHEAVTVLPKLGLMVGVALVVVGVAILSGFSLRLPTRLRARPLDGSLRSFFVLGVAQGVTALGCTLPVFLAVVGTSSTRGGAAGALGSVGAYATGAAALLVVLSAAVAFTGKAIGSKLRILARHSRAVGGVVLTASGVYLIYFWSRLTLTPNSSLSSDPLVSKVQAFSSWLYRIAGSSDAALLSVALVTGLFVVVVSVIWRGRSGSDLPFEQGGSNG